MVFKGELAVKLHTKDVEFETRSDRNPRQNQVTMGRVHSPGSLTTKASGKRVYSILATGVCSVYWGVYSILMYTVY